MLRILSISVCLLLFSGCALTVDHVPVNYTYTQRPLQNFGGISLHVENFTDSRIDAAKPNIIIHKMNAYRQKAPGGYAVEKPVSEIVQDVIEDGLRKANINTESLNPRFNLKGDIQKITTIGSVENSKDIVTWEIHVRFILAYVSGDILWRDNLIGRVSFPYSFFDFDDKPMVQKGFTLSLENLVKKLINDELFYKQLMKQ